MADLRVTGDTTLRDLQNFAASAGDGAKIRGRKNDDGSITLYASEKRSGSPLFNKARRAERQNQARNAINTVLTNTTRLPGLSRGNVETALMPMMHQLAGGGELRGAALKTLSSDARTAVKPELTLRYKIQDAIRTGDAAGIAAAADEFGDLVGARYGSSAGQAKLLSMNPDEAKTNLLDGLATKLGETTGPFNSTYATASADVKGFIDRVYARAVGQLPDRQTAPDKIMFNGKEYKRTKELARSVGMVELYENKDGEKLVIKTPLRLGAPTQAQWAKWRDDSRAELSAHLAAEGAGHKNIVQVKGAIPSADGTHLMMVMEFVPRGGADVLMEKLAAKLEAGKISPALAEAARLTILQDMLKGLAHIQRGGGAIHLDLKPVNFFVDAKGNIKMGDFGTSTQGATRLLKKNPVQNPRWLAPEVIKGSADYTAKTKAITRRAASEAQAMKELEATMTPAEFDAATKSMKELQKERKADHVDRGGFQVTEAADVWSLGAAAFEMLFGKTPFEEDGDQFNSDVEARITAFASNPNNRVLTAQKLGRPLTETEKLVNQMMHPDPTQRPSAADVLKHPAFNAKGVGGGNVRKFLAALAKE